MPRGERTASLKQVAAALDGDELGAILDIGISSLSIPAETKKRTPRYLDTPDGLENFRQASKAYFQYVKDVNAAPEGSEKARLVPDIESWASFLGITRAMLQGYERNRSEDWKRAIAEVKDVITACKKQLAFTGKMPPVLAIFDLTNNSGYVNASEYHLTADAAPEAKQITAEEWERVIDAEQEAPELANFELPDNLS